MPSAPAELFAEIYAQHLAIVWKTAHAFAVSRADREDLFQEILISLWEALPDFESRAKLSTYTYRIAHRRALNWKRSQRRYEGRLARYAQDFPELKMAQSDPGQQARLEWLYRAINELRPVDRTICLLHLDGLGYREMAEITGLTEENIGVRLYRCKQQLETMLTHRHEEF